MLRRVLIVPATGLAVLLSSLLVPAGPVFAHADYDRSEPARDAVLDQAPARVDVWFTQEVFRQEGSNFVRVFDESDTQVSEGDGVVDDDDRTHIFAELPSGLANGRYIVRWKSTSDEDGDEDEGAFCFYVGVEPSPAQATECAAFEEEEDEPTPTAGAAASATPVASQPTPTAAAPANGDDDGGVSTALIVVAAVVGVAIVAAVAGGAIVWFRRTLE